MSYKVTHITDGEGYRARERGGSGCKKASDILGRPSRCLDCKFDPCFMDSGRKRRPRKIATTIRELAVQKMVSDGKTNGEMAKILGVSLRAISRARTGR